jgi:hypothetical protein
MLEIKNITSDTKQRRTIILPDFSQIEMVMYFMPLQLGWFFSYLNYQNFTIRGLRITNNPNMLRQWKNILPFGMACFSAQEREPQLQQDFSSGASKIYILTSQEVKDYEEFLSD